MIEGHGDDSYKYGRAINIDFSSNISRSIDLSGLKTHLAECIASSGRLGKTSDILSSYPEPEPYSLEACLAKKFGLPSSSVCVTNGATEAIYLIAQTFRGTNSAILQPTFSEYSDACRMHAHRITSIYRLPACPGKSSDNIALPDEVRMLWLCNPNNPTGTVYDKHELIDLITAYPEVCFVMDQSYECFTLRPLFTASEAASYPNVLLLHSMTKNYAVPGLRLGYVTGVEGLLNRLRTNRMPWSVNRIAIEAGLYLIKSSPSGYSSQYPFNVAEYLEETARLQSALKRLHGLEVWDTHTHFFLVRLRYGKASALKEYLIEKHGILIRDASNFEGLDEPFFRISPQTPEENDALVSAIEEWINNV